MDSWLQWPRQRSPVCLFFVLIPRHHMATLKLLDVRVKEIIADEGNQFREKSTPGKFSVQPLPLLNPPLIAAPLSCLSAFSLTVYCS